MEENSNNFVFVEGNGEDIKDFYICKYQVTQKEYEDVIGYNPSNFSDNPDNPVERVTWYDAVMYCNKLSEREGLKLYYKIRNINYEWNDTITINAEIEIIGGNGYRLIEDKEWEYAAKGGKESKGYKYSGSNDINEVGWCYVNSKRKTQPVGQKNPNELGIYDMSGNVWEWTGTNTKSGSMYYLRGGACNSDESSCIITIQGSNAPHDRNFRLGFRICSYSKR
jgi:formylglycine-generating enzyme required for sulfatase activity